MNEKRRQYQAHYKKQYSVKTKRVNLTVSNGEYRDFCRAAETETMKVTSYIKQLALAGLEEQTHVPQEIKAALKTLLN